jgi:hypothetical protein
VRRFCAEYPNDKKAANLGQPPLPPLQSTYYSQLLSSGLAASLQHLAASASQSEQSGRHAGDQSQSANSSSGGGVLLQGGGGGSRAGVAEVGDELMINEYGPCDSFDFR